MESKNEKKKEGGGRSFWIRELLTFLKFLLVLSELISCFLSSSELVVLDFFWKGFLNKWKLMMMIRVWLTW